MIPRTDITGLVLAGGQGQRMGGLDKGLQLLGDDPLALHVLRRLEPQVGPVAINANRNLLEYEFLGAPVWPDSISGQPGPLAGLLTGLQCCTTPWLLTAACDTPFFPADLAQRLVEAATRENVDVVMAASATPPSPQPSPAPAGEGVNSGWRNEPVFCLVRASLRDDLAAHLAGGERQVERWVLRQRHAIVQFNDASAFFNANTPDELNRLRASLKALG